MTKDEEKRIWNKVVNPEDYEESADVLMELKYTHRELAEKLSLEVLCKLEEESYYQATVFDIFYSINQFAGLCMIRARLYEVNLVVLSAMIECVNEDVALLEGNEDILATVKAIDKRVDSFGREELEEIRETVDEFKELFGKYLP